MIRKTKYINRYIKRYCKNNKISHREVTRKLTESGLKYSYNGVHLIMTGKNICPPNFIYHFWRMFNIDYKLNIKDMFKLARYIPKDLCDECTTKMILHLVKQSNLIHKKQQKKNAPPVIKFEDFIK